MFLEEWNYAIKDKKIHNYILDDVEISPYSDEDNTDDEILAMKNSEE